MYSVTPGRIRSLLKDYKADFVLPKVQHMMTISYVQPARALFGYVFHIVLRAISLLKFT